MILVCRSSRRTKSSLVPVHSIYFGVRNIVKVRQEAGSRQDDSEFLLDEAVLEEHHDRLALSINIAVLHQGDHAINIHGLTYRIEEQMLYEYYNTSTTTKLTCEKLQILVPSKHTLHHFVHLCLKSRHLPRVRLIELSDNPKHKTPHQKISRQTNRDSANLFMYSLR